MTLWDALVHTYYTVLQAQLAGTSISRQWSKAGALNSRVAKFQNLDGDDFRQENPDHAGAAVLVDGLSLVIDFYRHPLDQQNTRLLKVLPGLETMAKNVLGMYLFMGHAQSLDTHMLHHEGLHTLVLDSCYFGSIKLPSNACPMPGLLTYLNVTIIANAGPVAEQVLLLENIGTSVLVGPEQLPSLHRLLITAASTLQMAPPDLYIKQV